MARTLGATILLALICFAAPSPIRAGPGRGEVTLLGAAGTGDYGTGIDTSSQAFTVRYVTGDDFQLRVDLSMVRFETSAIIGVTSLGPTPTGENRWQGPHEHGAAVSPSGASGAQTSSSTVVAPVEATGLGDAYLAASKRLVGGGVRLFRFDANLEVKVPTADEAQNLGTGEWDYRIGFAGEYRFWSATAYGGLGWNKLGDPSWVDFNDVLDLFVGVDSDPVAKERLILSGWLEGWQEAVESTGPRAALGFGLQTTGRVRFRFQVRTGLTNASPDVGVLFGVSFGISPPGPGVRGPQL
jgi:hypothetical protein